MRGVLYERQSGFRGGFSTDSCLIQLSDFVRQELASGNMVGMVVIDLRKAFDTVDHNILLNKLNAIGVDSSDWFSSYLTGRMQCVEINGIMSDFLPIRLLLVASHKVAFWVPCFFLFILMICQVVSIAISLFTLTTLPFYLHIVILLSLQSVLAWSFPIVAVGLWTIHVFFIRS